MMGAKCAVRLAVALVMILSTATLINGFLTHEDSTDRVESTSPNSLRVKETAGGKGTPSGITVVTTSERVDEGTDRNNLIVAFAADGEVVYRNDSHVVYNDVDPVPGTHATVLSVAADKLSRSECAATSNCWRNVVEEINLTTGEVRQRYSYITAVARGQWHDVDRIDENRLLIADIALDRVFVVNVTSGIVEWEWHAQSAFSLDGGGLFPGDWTHVNDVEYLDDGRVMVSLRNQDQVVFIDREKGVLEEWTLGREDDSDVLYEQHNPDFIPPEDGGPAIVVADSENDRVVEYQRSGGSWHQTWVWRDVDLQWPRDADRLPNGNTLITDSNGRRVFEVNRSGAIVWQVSLNGAYDAERLGTGDESANGPSAQRASLASRGADIDSNPRPTNDSGWTERIGLAVKDALPGIVVNAALFVAPPWIGFVELVALVILVATLLAWVLAEWRWSDWMLSVRLGRG